MLYIKNIEMMKRGVIFMLLMLIAVVASAQNISVASFRLLENDLTANTAGTIEHDQNGKVAALIKVVTTEQGFVFDGGMVGVVKTKQGVGEVWVYVPQGIKRITIQHPQLGVLRNYDIPISIEGARTYEMVLTTGRVETIVTHAVNKQFVVFNVKPIDAVIELGDEVLTVDSEGYATKSMPYGTYDYRITRANYHTTAGKVTVSAQGKAEVNVTLRPNFGWIRFEGDSQYHGAHIYIDNERVGQLPFVTDDIKSGEHRVKIVKSLYKTFEKSVIVSDDETTEVDVQLVPNFATVTLTADEDSEIWVDGERKAKGQWVGTLELGDYTVEVKKESHRTSSEIIQIKTIGERTIELKSPMPIYASLEISSTPLRATIYIDGVEVGETPLIKSDVLVGSHRITFKKEGYKDVEKTVVVEENTENKISVNLTKIHEDVPVNKSSDKVVTQPAKSNTPAPINPQKDETPKKKVDKGCVLGVDAGYTNYGFNYGGEFGLIIGRVSLTAGVKNHMMGKYVLCDNDMDGSNEEEHSVELARFSAKLGVTLGRRFQVIPQVGVLMGPSCLKGKEYVMNELSAWDGISSKYDKVLANKDYTTMNGNIMKFANTKYRLVAGARIGYQFAFGLGLHVTPEYVIGEGVAVNAGVSMKF